MGVDGLCSDFPELVDEANNKFRPQASQTDAATFPFPQGPDTASDVDMRGLVASAGTRKDAPTMNIGSDEDAAVTSRSGRVGSPFMKKKAEEAMDASALGGWYSRCHTCESSLDNSAQQRMVSALYGDLKGVRDFAVGAVEEAKVMVNACCKAEDVEGFLKGDVMKGKAATMELAAAMALCKEAEVEAEQALRPFVSSAETFQWSVNIIATTKVRDPCALVFVFEIRETGRTLVACQAEVRDRKMSPQKFSYKHARIVRRSWSGISGSDFSTCFLYLESCVPRAWLLSPPSYLPCLISFGVHGVHDTGSRVHVQANLEYRGRGPVGDATLREGLRERSFGHGICLNGRIYFSCSTNLSYHTTG